ncbi:MAG: F0F1 ATP synthase subunit I [Gammaproteobacteria bacterium]|nr:F0F1 ATP synthase subunit I [Gammaproteobacteria bacterium]
MQKVSNTRLLVRRLLIAQMLVVIGLPLLFLFNGILAGYSALIGTLTCFVPNVYFVYRTFKFSGARSAKLILRSFYAGESLKLLLTAVFFGLAFAFVKPIDVLAVFTGFIGVQATSWLVPWLVARKRN